MGKRIFTPKFRVAFPAVFVPTAMEEGQEKKYKITMLFDKSIDLTEIKAAIKDAVKEKWGDKIPKNLHIPLQDGDDKAHLTGYEGCWFINASNKRKPGIVDQNLQPIESEEEFYGGCYAKATIAVFAFDRPAKKGVSVVLNNIQKLADGDHFGSKAPTAEEDFGVVSSTPTEGTAGGSEEDFFS